MINTLEKLEATKESHPFCSAVGRSQLASFGYREEEYLFTGTSNVYRTGPNGKPEAEFANCPYTDRMIIRRPECDGDFSGSVMVEIINSTANFDIERIWAETSGYIMRHGHIYVGVTSKPNVFPALQRFDAGRYGRLNWHNPAYGAKVQPDPIEKVAQLGPEDQEMGLIWDILMELPAFLRGADSPVKGVRFVYLTGWSQSCSYINRLVNSFVYPDKVCREPLYDGYLAAGGVHSLTTPLNRYECNLPSDSMDRRIDFCPVPLIEINTESENSNFGGFAGYQARREDSNSPGFRYRYMEATGSCHDSTHTCRDYGRYDHDIEQALGIRLKGFDRVPCPNDYPKHFSFHVAMQNMVFWAEKGIPPISVPRISQSAAGINRKDAFGNTIGGMRTPLLELPVVRYCSFVENGDGSVNYLMGHNDNFSSTLIKELYLDAEHYRERAMALIQEEVSCGMVLQEDAAQLLDYCVNTAIRQGL